MTIKVTPTKQTNCTGKLVYKLSLPKCINRDLLEKFATYNYTNPERYTKSGLLHLTNNDIILSGSFSNKILSVYFKEELSEQDKLTKIDIVISMLEAIL